MIDKSFWGYLFVINLVFYASFPFLVLYGKFYIGGIEYYVLGAAVGAAYLSTVISGIISGALMDKYLCARGVILFAGLCCFLGYGALIGHIPLCFFAGSLLIGTGRGCLDTHGKLYITRKSHALVKDFGRRALTINSAAAMGSLVGIFLIKQHAEILLAMAMIAFCFISLQYVRFYIPNPSSVTSESLTASIKAKYLTVLILSLILALICYAQMDSSLPLYLIDHYDGGEHIFIGILFLNAIFALTLQNVASRIISNYGSYFAGLAGIGLFAIVYGVLLFPLTLLAGILLVT